MYKTLTLVICLLPTLGFAQIGTSFPTLEGENLIHGEILLPDDVSGTHTLVGLAFSKKSEKQLNSWFTPVYNQLIKEPAPGLFSFAYDVNVYFVPMLTGAKRPAYQQVMRKVEKDVDKTLHPHVLFYKGTLNEYKESLNVKDKDIPYLYLLDPSGKIIYASSGSYTQEKLQKVIDQLPFKE